MRRLSGVIRKLIGHRRFSKSLPPEFGGHTLAVCLNADMRFAIHSLYNVDPVLVELTRHMISPGDVVWDIGSNVGVFAFCAAYAAGVDGDVVCIEPDEEMCQMLRMSESTLPETFAPVEILNAAVSRDVAVTRLRVSNAGRTKNYIKGTGRTLPRFGFASTRPIVSVSLDWMLDSFRAPSFLKVDVEGAEVLVLQGGQRVLREIRPLIYVECDVANRGEIRNLFDAEDYRIFEIGFPPFTLDETTGCVADTLAIPDEKVSHCPIC